jgi:hypothetical protein
MNTGMFLNQQSMYNGDGQGNEQSLRGEALDLYIRMSTSGKLHRTLNFLRHKSRSLLSIASSKTPECRLNRHFAGLQNVAIEQIRGTDSREGDFDDSFYPLHDRMRSRWLGVAAARLSGRELPPVELTQVGGIFYVQDGHHRISVARALGEDFIDAEVIDLDC